MKFTDQGISKIKSFIEICEELLKANPLTKDSDETLRTTHLQIKAAITVGKILLDNNNAYGWYFWWSSNRNHFNAQVNIIDGNSRTYVPKICHPLGFKLLIVFKSLIEMKDDFGNYFIFEGIADAVLDKFGINEKSILSKLAIFEWNINNSHEIYIDQFPPSNEGNNKNQDCTNFVLEEDSLSKNEPVNFSSSLTNQNLSQEPSLTLGGIDILIDELSDDKNLTKSNTAILESQFEKEVQQSQSLDSLIEDMSQPPSLQGSEIQSSKETSTENTQVFDDPKIRQRRVPKKGNSDGEFLGRKMDSFISRYSLATTSSKIMEMCADTLNSNDTPILNNSDENQARDLHVENPPELNAAINSSEVDAPINTEQGIFPFKPRHDPNKSQTIIPLTVFEFFVQEFNTAVGAKINLSDLFSDSNDITIKQLKNAIKDLKANNLNLVEVSEKEVGEDEEEVSEGVDFKKAYDLLIQFSLRTATFYGIKSDYIKNLSTALFAKLILQQKYLRQQSAQTSDSFPSSPSILNGLLELMKQEVVTATTSKELVKIVRRHSEQVLALDQAISAGKKFIKENSKQNKKEFINAVATAMETFHQSPSHISKVATVALCGLVLSAAVSLVISFAILFPPSVLFTVPLLGKVTAAVACTAASVLSAGILGGGFGLLGHTIYAQKLDQAAQKESAPYREALIIKECLIQTYSP